MFKWIGSVYFSSDLPFQEDLPWFDSQRYSLNLWLTKDSQRYSLNLWLMKDSQRYPLNLWLIKDSQRNPLSLWLMKNSQLYSLNLWLMKDSQRYPLNLWLIKDSPRYPLNLRLIKNLQRYPLNLWLTLVCKLLYIQGVPINMGIQWRIRYRLCSRTSIVMPISKAIILLCLLKVLLWKR